MQNKVSPTPEKKPDEKFYFHLHVFDDENEETEEIVEQNLPPPPPMFSEEELAQAKSQAFEEGKKQGIEEAQNSIQKQTAQLAEHIKNNFAVLLAEEERRARIFENEAVELSLAVFDKAFPKIYEKYNMAELQRTLLSVIHNHASGPKITVHVAPEMVEGIKGLTGELSSSTVEIKGSEGMATGACKLEWSDGGAVMDIPAVAEKIRQTLQQFLEDNGINSQDRDIKEVVEEKPQEKSDE